MTAVPHEPRIKPVFIGGCPRSGTTLLANLLGQKLDNSIVTPESQFKFELGQFTGDDGEIQELPAPVEFIRQHPRFRIWGYDWSPSLVEARSDHLHIGRLLEGLVLGYGGSAHDDPVCWIDHTPQNLRYAAYLEVAFPTASFIHLIRDGRAVARSVLPLDWGPNTIHRAAQWWQRHVGFGLAAKAGGGVSAVVVGIRYEDLVTSPNETVERIVDEIGVHHRLSSRSEDASAGGFDVPGYSRQQHQLVGLEPDATRIHAWKEELSLSDVEVFEYYAGEMLELLGYERLAGSTARRPGIVSRLLSYMKHLLWRPVNYYRRKKRLKRSL